MWHQWKAGWTQNCDLGTQWVNVRTKVKACDCTRGLSEPRKKVFTESCLWKTPPPPPPPPTFRQQEKNKQQQKTPAAAGSSKTWTSTRRATSQPQGMLTASECSWSTSDLSMCHLWDYTTTYCYATVVNTCKPSTSLLYNTSALSSFSDEVSHSTAGNFSAHSPALIASSLPPGGEFCFPVVGRKQRKLLKTKQQSRKTYFLGQQCM